MSRPSREFINPEFLAPNVLEIDLPESFGERLSGMIAEICAITQDEGPVRLSSGLNLHVARPPGWNSDIRWISQGDEAAFGFFAELFELSGAGAAAARHIDHDRQVRLYSGFFVTRSRCQAAHFHQDWQDNRNDAFTMIAPLTENCADLGLVYRTFRGEERSYAYRPGKALLFGDRFIHSTAPGTAAERTVLLSFTFGTDRMERWADLSRFAAHQGLCHQRPDGQFVSRAMSGEISP